MAHRGCRVCGGPLFRGQCPNRALHACRVCGGELMGDVCLDRVLHPDFELPSEARAVAAGPLAGTAASEVL